MQLAENSIVYKKAGFAETLFWVCFSGFPSYGNLGMRQRALARFRVAWCGSEGDRTKLGVRWLARGRFGLRMCGIHLSLRSASDGALKLGVRRTKYGYVSRQIWHGSRCVFAMRRSSSRAVRRVSLGDCGDLRDLQRITQGDLTTPHQFCRYFCSHVELCE